MAGEAPESYPMTFRLRVWLARTFDMYRYPGLTSMAGARGYPLAQVRYPDGRSTPMAIGTAVVYAELFGGTVVPVRETAAR